MTERNYAWYTMNGEEVIITNIVLCDGKWVSEIEKFNQIECYESGETSMIFRIKDIEAAGIEITPADVCLCYDDCYAGGWNGPEEIKECQVKNFENEQCYLYEYVTSAYWNEN